MTEKPVLRCRKQESRGKAGLQIGTGTRREVALVIDLDAVCGEVEVDVLGVFERLLPSEIVVKQVKDLIGDSCLRPFEPRLLGRPCRVDRRTQAADLCSQFFLARRQAAYERDRSCPLLKIFHLSIEITGPPLKAAQPVLNLG